MRNGKMKIFIGEIRFSGIRDADQVIRKSGIEVAKEEPPCQVLKPFVRMTYLPLKRDRFFKKTFSFFYPPHPYPGVVVDSMLKKNGHGMGFNPYFAGLQIDN